MGKGRFSFLTMFSSAISGEGCPGPGLPVASILSSGWIWGFRRASATGGPRTLTGSSHSWKGVGHSWQGGLAPTVRLGEADLGFQKGLSDRGGLQNPDDQVPENPAMGLDGHSWQGGLAPDCPARRSIWGPDALSARPLNAPTGGGPFPRRGGFSCSPALPFC